MMNFEKQRRALIAKNSLTNAHNRNYKTLDQRNYETNQYRSTQVDRYNPSTRGNYNYFSPTKSYK